MSDFSDLASGIVRATEVDADVEFREDPRLHEEEKVGGASDRGIRDG